MAGFKPSLGLFVVKYMRLSSAARKRRKMQWMIRKKRLSCILIRKTNERTMRVISSRTLKERELKILGRIKRLKIIEKDMRSSRNGWNPQPARLSSFNLTNSKIYTFNAQIK